MKIEVSTTERTKITDAGAKSTMDEEVFVNSQTELFAVHYTKPKFDKRQKQYEVTAYIDREEAWRIYEPKLSDAADSFRRFYADAQAQNGTLSKIIALSKAVKNARETELLKKLDFALILNPDRAELFDVTRSNLAEIEPTMRRLAKNCTVRVEVNSDFEERISKSVKETFSKIGIKTQESGAEYVCTVEVTENAQTLAAGIFFTPSFTVQIEKSENVIWSVSKQLKKVGAKNENIARQRAFSAVAGEIQKSLQSELAF